MLMYCRLAATFGAHICLVLTLSTFQCIGATVFYQLTIHMYCGS